MSIIEKDSTLVKTTLDTEKLNELLDVAVSRYLNTDYIGLRKHILKIILKIYKNFLIILIFKLKIISPDAQRKTFWGNPIQMIGVRPYSLYISGYIGNDDLFITRYIINNLRKGDTFLDVGANIGFFTLLASVIVGENGKVYSFEPIPNTYKYLETNVSNKQNVEIYKLGIHNKPGLHEILDFGAYNNFYNSLGEKAKLVSQLSDLRHGGNTETLMIRTITLDEFCTQNNVIPNIIKLDTEDTEDLILSTSINTLEKYKPEVIFEMFNLSVQEGRLQKIISSFSSMGYSCYQFCGDEIVPLENTKDAKTNYYNFLLTTKEVLPSSKKI